VDAEVRLRALVHRSGVVLAQPVELALGGGGLLHLEAVQRAERLRNRCERVLADRQQRPARRPMHLGAGTRAERVAESGPELVVLTLLGGVLGEADPIPALIQGGDERRPLGRVVGQPLDGQRSSAPGLVEGVGVEFVSADDLVQLLDA
jgi:hypothetical protein